MVLQKLWVSQNFILVEFHGSRSLVFLAVMCVSQSRFLYEGVSESRFFARLRVSKSRFICLFVCFKIISSRHTSPKLSELHKKLENLPQRHFTPEKSSYFVLGYNNVVF